MLALLATAIFQTDALKTYAAWIALAGIVLMVLTLGAWLWRWGIRFRLVGVTSFTFVIAASVFALSLGFSQRERIPNAVQYVRVFDRAADQVVIAIPTTVTEVQLSATLQQAAIDLFSPGRTSPDGMMTIRARTVLHPEDGVSLPLYLGQIRRSLSQHHDPQMQIDLYRQNLALLPGSSDVTTN
jgi:hypothetical protein